MGDSMKLQATHFTVIAAAIIVALAVIIGLSGLRKSDYITVSGQSEVPIEPDRAVLYFTLNTQEETAQQTQEADAAAAQRISEAVKAEGFGAVETQNYWLNKRIEWTENGSVERGYQLMHSFKVTVGAADASDALKAAVEAGANGVDRIEFLSSQAAKDKAVAEAMAQASGAARQKAQQAARAIKAELGRPLKLEETGYWIVASTEPSAEEAAVPEQYRGSVIAPQRMAVQGNVNAVFAVG